MKTCQDLINDFSLNVEHCNSCHEELISGMQDPQPISINDTTYSTPCCIVEKALKDKKINFKYL